MQYLKADILRARWSKIRREGKILERHELDNEKGCYTLFSVEYKSDLYSCSMLNGEVLELVRI